MGFKDLPGGKNSSSSKSSKSSSVEMSKELTPNTKSEQSKKGK